ncbi:PREDICTED: fibrous sheath CABYR-binding protein-like isoform X2 [Bactrocera latifrons]|uniref:fibrous sheath CABYR-binding protein-like isoform X1 n=1 Tax=Bactrocera latifrons TaxID=174628 RepID=UPI0008DD42CC|nr:PREDICTED: fibrous sheath CABYR-binding protein-like isoform X1 [Bactrocera latifrons]XP_018785345.1 PREDICTED: fibrous sheath CABYR-binding protein-like isoform X2 [Bactrocera latifrons]
MARFLQILLVASLAFALCAAEAPRFRGRNGRLQLSKQRSRFLARQEAAEEAGVTPYPSAKELIPEIPFDEAAAAAAAPEVPVEAPAVQEGDVNVSVNDDLPAEQAPAEEEADEPALADDAEGEHEPDLIYGPPEAEDVPTEEQAAAEEAIESARLTSGRPINARNSARPAKLRAAVRAPANSVKSAKIVKATKTRSARLQQLPQQQQLFVPQKFAAQQQQQS